MARRRLAVQILFAVGLAWAQFRESGAPELAAHLTIATEPAMPVRVYLSRNGRPFRLSPVQALLPLRVDLFYRERLWLASNDPDTLEVTCNDQSHFFLLKGRASFDLPAGRYRIDAFRGFFYVPASSEFELRAGENRTVSVKLENWAGAAREEWLSGDDHIHLTRAASDNPVFLRWLEAEDLTVANFLQLQRQMDAAVQYAFGPAGQATRGGRHTIRPGHESRSEFFGHVNLLGGREMIRPLSVGRLYANSPDTSLYPSLIFARAQRLGATVGYAHFNGSTPHSTLLMDLANGGIDFVEVFQFGVLKTAEWYELLNAGFRATGIAGSDFPVPLNRVKEWPRWLPLLGPERTLVRARPVPDPYTAWADGIRKGQVIVTNGPLVEVSTDRSRNVVRATASFYRPLTLLEIVRNGEVVASAAGDGRRTQLSLSATLPGGASCWVAARVAAAKEPGEPDIQAHTNPLYLLDDGKPLLIPAARQSLARKWRAELAWYRTGPLEFRTDAERREFFRQAEKTLAVLTK